MRRVVLAVAACLALVAPACAQGIDCADFLLEHDGSWRSFITDEMLLPQGPVPIHKGERFVSGVAGPKGFIARILDAQCRPGGPLY